MTKLRKQRRQWLRAQSAYRTELTASCSQARGPRAQVYEEDDQRAVDARAIQPEQQESDARSTLAGKRLVALVPGLFVASAIVAVATVLEHSLNVPQMLGALLLGALTAKLFPQGAGDLAPGFELCAKRLLRLGVGLLGINVTSSTLSSFGPADVGVVSLGMGFCMASAMYMAARLGLSAERGYVCAASVAVCGASAALAVSSVLPGKRGKEEYTATVIGCVTILSSLAMLIYGPLASALGLTDHAAGVFLGGSIHDVAQVLAASISYGEASAQHALIAKLFRISLLAPVVGIAVLLFTAHGRSTSVGGWGSIIPGFLWLFVGVAALRVWGLVPEAVVDPISQGARYLTVAAVGALGAKLSLQKVRKAGLNTLLVLTVATVTLGVTVALGVLLLG